jgi:hypothetical protein
MAERAVGVVDFWRRPHEGPPAGLLVWGDYKLRQQLPLLSSCLQRGPQQVRRHPVVLCERATAFRTEDFGRASVAGC